MELEETLRRFQERLKRATSTIAPKPSGEKKRGPTGKARGKENKPLFPKPASSHIAQTKACHDKGNQPSVVDSTAPTSVKPGHNKNEWLRKGYEIPTDADDVFSEALKLNNISLTEKPAAEIMTLAKAVFNSHTGKFKPGCPPPNSIEVMKKIPIPDCISASLGVGHYSPVELAVLLAFMVLANSDSAPGLLGPHVLRRQKEGIKGRLRDLGAYPRGVARNP